MSFLIERREKEGIAILDLAASLVAGEAAGALRDTVRQMASEGSLNVVLNLERVDHIDSTGLDSMVVCFTTVSKGSGRLVLLNLKRRHMELLVLTKLYTVFEIFDNEQDAVNSFFPNRSIRHFDILRFVEDQRPD
jgi:anti-sigma B factor antagonist